MNSYKHSLSTIKHSNANQESLPFQHLLSSCRFPPAIQGNLFGFCCCCSIQSLYARYILCFQYCCAALLFLEPIYLQLLLIWGRTWKVSASLLGSFCCLLLLGLLQGFWALQSSETAMLKQWKRQMCAEERQQHRDLNPVTFCLLWPSRKNSTVQVTNERSLCCKCNPRHIC